MKKAINSLWNITSDHGFVILLSVAAIVHSAWSINSVFNGAEPVPMYSQDWWGWYLPGLLMAITIDVGLVQFVFKIQKGERGAALIVAYLVLCGLMAFGQFIYVASHMADITPSVGVAVYDLPITNMLIKVALYVYPLALPVVSAIYAFSVRGQVAPTATLDVDRDPVTVNIIHRPEPTAPALSSVEIPALPEPETVNSDSLEMPVRSTALALELSSTGGAFALRKLRTSDRHCGHCGQPLPTNSRRKYCDDTCKQLAYVARKSAMQ